jgi:WD40 repeat protein
MKPAGSVHFEPQRSCILPAFPKGDKSIIRSLLQVSTHGYPGNQVLVWQYPGMTQVADLAGHAGGVLYLAMSPYGDRIATGSADKTLRLWDIFSRTEARPQKVSAQFIQWEKVSHFLR